MRRRMLAVCLLVGLLCGPAAAAPLCEYRSPRTSLTDLVLGFSYQYYRDPYGVVSRDINQGQFRVGYTRLFDEPQYGYDISFFNQMDIVVGGDSEYVLRADGNYKRYFEAQGDTFAFAGAQLRSTSSSQRIGLSLSLGLGSGRFTDVTPLAKALRINEVLLRRGSLVRDLHLLDLQVLAEDIEGAASKPEAALISELLKTLERSGAVRLEGLDALDAYRISQIIQGTRISRWCGWDLKAGVGYELLSPASGDNEILLTSTFNYAVAATARQQILFTGIFSGALDVAQMHRIDLSSSYEYLIFDFLSTKAAYVFSRETWVGQPTDTHRVSVDFVLSPLEATSITAGLVMESKPHYLHWSIDLRFAIETSLL
jgi:hypothetical protein